MDFFMYTDFQISASQIMLEILLSSLALLFGRVKLALLVNYMFVFYWGFISNQVILYDRARETAPMSLYIYLSFGLFIVILSLIGFLREE